MEETPAPEVLLHTCGGQLSVTDRFCPSCGGVLQPEKTYENVFNAKWLLYVLGYYAFCLVVFLGIEYGNFVQDLDDFYTLDILDAVITVAFALIGIRQLYKLYSFKNVSFTKLLIYIPVTVVASFIVSYLITLMNQGLFNEYINYSGLFAGTEHPILYMIISIAIYPAVFEEMAFRGFLYNGITNMAGEKNAVYISSILFTIVHFSILSVFWILPFALIVANLRRKHNTLWYGMVIHFVFNLTACLIEVYGLIEV